MELIIIQNKIYDFRGHKVLLDFDLAQLYQVQTKVLNQAVKRNISRFPRDFMFKLSEQEWNSLRSQIVTLEPIQKGKHTKYLPFAFTEQGIAMLSGVLNSSIAIEVNINIMRTFVMIRQYALTHLDLNLKLKELENKFDVQFKDVFEAINFLFKEGKQKEITKNRKKIGYKIDK